MSDKDCKNKDHTNILHNSIIKPAKSYIASSLHDAVILRIGNEGLAAAEPQTIPQLFRENCRAFADLPALAYEPLSENNNAAESDTWTVVTFEDYERKVQQAALILLHVGLEPRTSVGILSCNCPEWFYVQFGAMRTNSVVAGIYPTNIPDAVFHVLSTSNATVCVVDDAVQMAKVRAIKSKLPRLKAVIQLQGPFDFEGNEEGYYRWTELTRLRFGADLQLELERREREVAANECAMLVYTSGTVGLPKGVMISHDNLLASIREFIDFVGTFENGMERIVTFLPVSHIAPQYFDIFLPLLTAGCTYFADKYAMKGTLIRTLRKAKPTIIFAVPRVFEKMQEQFSLEDSKASFFKRFVWRKSTEVVLDYHLGRSTFPFKHWFASIITNEIKTFLGLECAKYYFAGGAPVSLPLKEFFLSLGINIIDAYGMSEISGCLAIDLESPEKSKVGRPLRGFEVKISNPDKNGHGEICCKGRPVFMGYINQLNKTKEVLTEDGWMHSGDFGYIDSNGNLFVSGRIKEIIITSGGENIPPAYIEDLIKSELTAISNALLVGDQRKYITVLLTFKTKMDKNSGRPLDELMPETIDWLSSLGLTYTCLSEFLGISADIQNIDVSNVEVQLNPTVVEAIEKGIKRVNMNVVSRAHMVQKFSVLPYDFSPVTGELGPTLKTRRFIILKKYASVIDRMYL